jgi:predicted enzyme related to lactoylglutathione lyase
VSIQARYAHTNLTTRDWRRLAAFYRDVFGCVPKGPERDLSGPWLDRLTALERAHLTGIHMRLPGLGPDGPTLEIFSYDETIAGPAPVVNHPGFGHLAFLVDDVAAALDAVLRAGGSAVGEISGTDVPGVGRLRAVYARDPDGNILELLRWS